MNRNVLLSGLICALFISCSEIRYTTIIDPSLKKTKLKSATIAVFPIENLSYSPYKSSSDASRLNEKRLRFQNKWNRQIRKTIGTFKNQKWIFLGDSSGAAISDQIDIASIKDIAGSLSSAEKVDAYSGFNVMYKEMSESSLMHSRLNPLNEMTGADYAMVFILPNVYEDIDHRMVMSGAAGYHRVREMKKKEYTAEVQIQVWECASGKMLFSSGVWKRTSMPCLPIPTHSWSISGATGQLKKKLKMIISSLEEIEAWKNVARLE